MYIPRDTDFLPWEWAGMRLSVWDTPFHTSESLLGLVFHPLSWARPGSVLPQAHGSQFPPFNINALFSHQAPSCMASYIHQLSSVGLFLPGKGPSIWHIRASGKATLLSGYSLFTFSWAFRELMYFPMCLKPFSFTQICPFPSAQALKWQLLTLTIFKVVGYSNSLST